MDGPFSALSMPDLAFEGLRSFVCPDDIFYSADLINFQKRMFGNDLLFDNFYSKIACVVNESEYKKAHSNRQ